MAQTTIDSVPSLLKHEQSKRPTLDVLVRIREQLRERILADTLLLDRLAARLSESTERTRLAEWLAYVSACRTTKLSDERPFTESAQMASQECSIGVVEDTKLLRLTGAGSGRNGSTTSPFDFDAAHSRVLVAAGLGMVFIRFCTALRRSYYHWLLCDLLPDKIRLDVMETLAVPEGAGTIGWATKRAYLHRSRTKRPPVTALELLFGSQGACGHRGSSGRQSFFRGGPGLCRRT